ncbi:MAG: hypothetical protein IPI67_11775 [Myxococcales bacterium]|nr:hypothetical protein [Myxococcales bacterium]
MAKRITKRAANSRDQLSTAVWVLGREAESSGEHAISSLAPILEAVAHAIEPEEDREALSRRATQALARMRSEAMAFLKAHIGPSRCLTPAETYDLLLEELDHMLAKRCTLLALEIVAGAALEALSAQGVTKPRASSENFDRERLAQKLEKMMRSAKRCGQKELLDRAAVVRELLVAGGMSSAEIRQLKKARSKRERRADMRD